MNPKHVYAVYKSLEPSFHNEQGHLVQVTRGTRNIVKDNMRTLGISGLEHAQIMLKIQEMHQNLSDEEFDKQMKAMKGIGY